MAALTLLAGLFALLSAAAMVRDGYNHWYFYMFLLSAVTALWSWREGRNIDREID